MADNKEGKGHLCLNGTQSLQPVFANISLGLIPTGLPQHILPASHSV
jgi:hypothetical protein